jgi:hypothetical protein
MARLDARALVWPFGVNVDGTLPARWHVLMASFVVVDAVTGMPCVTCSLDEATGDDEALGARLARFGTLLFALHVQLEGEMPDPEPPWSASCKATDSSEAVRVEPALLSHARLPEGQTGSVVRVTAVRGRQDVQLLASLLVVPHQTPSELLLQAVCCQAAAAVSSKFWPRLARGVSDPVKLGAKVRPLLQHWLRQFRDADHEEDCFLGTAGSLLSWGWDVLGDTLSLEKDSWVAVIQVDEAPPPGEMEREFDALREFKALEALEVRGEPPAVPGRSHSVARLRPNRPSGAAKRDEVRPPDTLPHPRRAVSAPLARVSWWRRILPSWLGGQHPPPEDERLPPVTALAVMPSASTGLASGRSVAVPTGAAAVPARATQVSHRARTRAARPAEEAPVHHTDGQPLRPSENILLPPIVPPPASWSKLVAWIKPGGVLSSEMSISARLGAASVWGWSWIGRRTNEAICRALHSLSVSPAAPPAWCRALHVQGSRTRVLVVL